MAVIQNIIVYNARNFDEVMSLVQCFIDSNPSSVVNSFEAKHENLEWVVTITYLAELAKVTSIDTATSVRLDINYNDIDQTPAPLISDFKVWINGNEIAVTIVVISVASNHCRVEFDSAFAIVTGDIIFVDFCNTQGMTAEVGTFLCESFVRTPVINTI